MEKISEEEFAALAKRKSGRKHPVTVAVADLKPGEILHIMAADWKWTSHSPSILVTREAKKTRKRFDFYKLNNNSGWVVKRLS